MMMIMVMTNVVGTIRLLLTNEHLSSSVTPRLPGLLMIP